MNDRKIGELIKCKCGRKILVERKLIGVNHTLEVSVTCWECLDSKAKRKLNKLYDLK